WPLLSLAATMKITVFLAGSGNEFTVSSFDKGIDRQTNREAIARLDTRYSNGARDIKKTNIIGSYSQIIDDLESSTVLANNFEGTLEDRYIEVSRRTVKRPVYRINSNKKLNYETTYRTLDLSGVDARDYNAGNKFSGRRGIFTDLNNYKEIPNDIAFPTGSVCYIPVTTSERSFFVFNAQNKTGYKDLDKWIDATENQFSDNRQFSTTIVKVGTNNKQEAAQVKFFATNDEPEYIYNGVDHQDAIYQASYVASGTTKPNENSFNGVVDCTLVNEVAADFLEREIKRYY
ncbi:hypothetical protein, partial [Psychrobacter sp. H8-1]|uniref:hypothetical protein n=1 Tax=Psychrobacter sp. H8-1 TaxID=2774129 RepID=UPI00191B2284